MKILKAILRLIIVTMLIGMLMWAGSSLCKLWKKRRA